MFFVFLFKESLDFVVILIKPVLVFARESIAEDWKVSLKTVQFSFNHLNGGPLHLIGCRYH